MGVSFRISRTGTRYCQKPSPTTPFAVEDEEAQNDAVIGPSDKKNSDVNYSVWKLSRATSENQYTAEISDNDISFTLSLFPDGYSIGKPVENESGPQTPFNAPKFLHQYDRASETLFSAIECGQFPGDILDDIPCKFIDGRAFCEVRDYRKCTSEGGSDSVPGKVSPVIINRVCLRISLENIVKDIPTIADNGWTYGDLMEVESRILKALQPHLCLDPTPKLDKLSGISVPTKLNFELRSMRRKRLQQISEAAMFSDNKIQSKKVCLDRVPESSMVQQSAHGNLIIQNNASNALHPMRNNSFGSDNSLHAKYHIGIGSPKMKDHWSGALSNVSLPSHGNQDMMNPFSDNGTTTVHGKRDDQDGQSSPLINKKARLMPTGGADGNLPHSGSQIENLHGSDLNWKNTLMQQQSQIARGVQYSNNGMQNFSQQFEGSLNQEGGAMPFNIGQQGIRYNLKEEPVDSEGLDKPESNNIDSRLQQRMPAQQFMRSGFPQSPWNNLNHPLDNNSRKDDAFQKRKLVQSPRVSASGLPQSPLSSRSGEFSSGSQFGGVVSSGMIASQKEKSAVPSISVPHLGGNSSFTSNANEAMQRQHQAQAVAKRRSNSLPKAGGISGVGSPASVGTMSVPINASSPPVGHQPLADQSLLERFSKIEVVTMKRQPNCKKDKMDEFPMTKPNAFSAQELAHELSDTSNENLKDETCKTPLSKSLVGGNMNVCKTRILNFVLTERIPQGNGNGYQLVPKARTRVIMSEKPNDGSVAIHIGEIDDADYLSAADYLPTLPNTHMADLLAAQFASLMTRDGYHLEDHLQPNPVQMNHAPIGQLNAPGIPPSGPTSEMQQFSEGVSGQPSNDVKPSISSNSLQQNIQQQGPRMLPPGGNTQTVQVSQALLSSSRQPEQMSQPQQYPLIQQQQQQFQRSQMMLGSTNSMQHLNNIAQNANIHLGAHMATNKPSSLQLQLLQQQQPQQLLQSQQQQRKMMGSLGTVGMGNIGNNMVGLGNFGNAMGLGGVRGVGGPGISAPIGNMSNIGNMNQNPMNLSAASNISNAIRSLTPQQAAIMKMRLAQGRANMNMMGGPQSGIGAMSGVGRQMNPGAAGLSMLGSALNRGNMNQMQRTAMGPPKIVPGMNAYMNQQQQQQFQQQQQLHLQQQQQMQIQQQQQQETTTSPLQQAVMSPQMGSPSNIGISNQMNQSQQQQQASPQQMSQRTPMSPQLSAGAMHQMNSGGNQDACPASPQVSSQTLGSVGNNNSPMDLQGVNKSNSANNNA